MEILDLAALLLILSAWLGAKPPIKRMIFFCFACLAVMDVANVLALNELIKANSLWRVMIGTELFAAIIFVLWAYRETGRPLVFCRVMAWMFMLSVFCTAQFYIGERLGVRTWSWEKFKFLSEAVTFVHIIMMLVFSDGIRDIFYNYRHSFDDTYDRH